VRSALKRRLCPVQALDASPVSPLYLPYISPISPLYLPSASCRALRARARRGPRAVYSPRASNFTGGCVGPTARGALGSAGAAGAAGAAGVARGGTHGPRAVAASAAVAATVVAATVVAATVVAATVVAASWRWRAATSPRTSSSPACARSACPRCARGRRLPYISPDLPDLPISPRISPHLPASPRCAWGRRRECDPICVATRWTPRSEPTPSPYPYPYPTPCP
jgi:hypothetical protein